MHTEYTRLFFVCLKLLKLQTGTKCIGKWIVFCAHVWNSEALTNSSRRIKLSDKNFASVIRNLLSLIQQLYSGFIDVFFELNSGLDIGINIVERHCNFATKKCLLVALQSPPFVMKKENSTETDSGVDYEGFCIDLLNELRKKLQFEYELELKDSFGEKQPDGTWNGIIGDLTRKVNWNDIPYFLD